MSRPTHHSQEDRKNQRAKQEIAAQQQERVLPESEWNFLSTGNPRPPEWQWNHWLNYEYARSSDVIVEAVGKLRARKIKKRFTGNYPQNVKVPQFAVYLKQYYPEFPDTPWLKLPPERRSRRILERSGRDLRNPFERDVLKVHDPFVFIHEIQTGEIDPRPGSVPRVNDLVRDADGEKIRRPAELRGEKFAVFEIDFTQGNKLIVKKFREWLAGRREELQKLFAGTNLANMVKASRGRMNVGQRGNLRMYVTRFNQLAALRLMRYHQGDFSTCTKHTGKVLGTPLFADDLTGWTRPQKNAEELMRRFHIAWMREYFPVFILQPEMFYESIYAPTIGRPFSSTTKRNSIASGTKC